jgi:hypothetical protein
MDNRINAKRALILGALLALALAIRLYGIDKESFWVDESWSGFLSQHPTGEILRETAADVHPPLHYLGLHAWRSFWGETDGRLRAYSTVWSLIALIGVFLLARDIAGWRVGVLALLFGAVNPQDIYFAQEARMYTQAAALGIWGGWFLWRWIHAREQAGAGRVWPWAVAYTIAAAGSLYTHYLSIHLCAAQGLFALAYFASRRRWKDVVGLAGCAAATAVLFLPWLLYVLTFRKALYNPALGWIKLPAATDYFSFLGREFIWGQVESLHDRWWPATIWITAVLLALLVYRYRKIGDSNRISRHARLFSRGSAKEIRLLSPIFRSGERLGIAYSLWLLAGTILLAVIADRLYHPIYYRPRFTALVVPPFVILAALGCDALRRAAAIGMAAAAVAGLMFTGACIQDTTFQKIRFQEFVALWKQQGPRGRTVYFPPCIEITPAWYARDRLIHAPSRKAISAWLSRLQGLDIWICTAPMHNFRNQEGEYDYYQWLIRQGAVRNLLLPNSVTIQILRIGPPPAHNGRPIDEWFAPVEMPTHLEGFTRTPDFYAPEFDFQTSAPFAWSGPRARLCFLECDRAATVVLNLNLPPRLPADHRFDLKIYAKRGSKDARLFTTRPAAQLNELSPPPAQIAVPVPRGIGPLWLGWTIHPVNLAKAGVSAADRDLGLRINWVGLIHTPQPESPNLKSANSGLPMTNQPLCSFSQKFLYTPHPPE